ncbi:dTDP-4-dehydrorhamnose 3,5-epimerase [Allochromatium vinosum]|uniref:dTDP-4-dehydrorhamnose 3,5-epimerase n=1 Tax=Allochromatium vinosum (strain ATCC 17899 / DSM 180 / NBRC 103801 / NCIMB 10441 / D) TaxID=572477 RepID=D3RUK0_ALLVD|nr:dTDP-4-dehydrorhamnose 3,5-epimerase [Allochromatium vinosum]ADC62859.1 dTDP-4-dehydrorhamnose 3,5-epimerase [Allochromatium vinosum DSM 180]
MSQRFRLQPTALAGVVVVERQPIADERGWFERLFCARELESVTHGQPIVQINRSLTHRRGTVRGLHYQHPPHAETKIVTCLRGEIFDVAVDLRAGSPTFLHWHGERLSAADGRMLVIPEGCAHGFQTLSDDAELFYLNTAEYVPASESGLHPEDPRLDVRWPGPITQLSSRDRGHPPLDPQFEGLSL